MAFACQVDDPDIGLRFCRRGLQDREKLLGEEEVADVVGAELDLVAFFCECRWLRHDAGVVHEDVEAVVIFEEGLRGGFDGGEGSEVEFEVFDEICCAGDSGGDPFHGCIVFGLRARAEVDLRRVMWCDV